MKTGLLVKGVGGFYDVLGPDGTIRRCTARGAIKNKFGNILVGDRVKFEARPEDEYGTVELVEDRINSFIRPPVANVDCFIIVASRKMPEVGYGLIDRFLAMAEHKHTKAILCLSKADLIADQEIEEFKKIYGGLYPIHVVSNLQDQEGDLDGLAREMAGMKIALAGPSGVGKSTLLNRLLPGLNVQTGDISSKSQRGKHTTRHVELFPWRDGYVFDTPGFSQLEYVQVDRLELRELFPEIADLGQACKFSDCSHSHEPECQVIQAVKEGRISQTRYNSYLEGLKEIEAADRR